MILTGKTEVLGEKHYTLEYGAIVEWYWQRKTEILGEKHYTEDCGFGLEKSVRKICAKAANDGAEAASPGNRTRHAGLRRKWFQLPEHRDHWWWVMGLRVRPRNKGAVLTMETFIIPEAKESTAGPQQRQGFVDCFSRLLWGGASQIRTTRPNRHQTVLRGTTLSPS